MAVKAIPLANGDLHWVFPQLADPELAFDLMLDGRSGPERDCRRVA
jgi:hypothetical protein